MEGKLIKINNIYTLMVNDKMIASDDEDFQIDYEINKLSLKNCQAVELGYDLDELANEWVFEKNVYRWSTVEDNYESFKAGFQKAVEILGDKKFSEKDIERAFIQGVYTKTEIHRKKEEYIQSLQQTEWNVIIEMECPVCKEWGYISECRNNSNQKFLQPKLDNNGCLILKRK